MPSSSPAIEARQLAKVYRGRTLALADLTLRVERGTIFGFLGPNGAGKTTAVKMLLGLIRPTAGSASVLGAPLGAREPRRAIGYLPELFRYQEWLSGREVLTFHARLAGIPGGERNREIVRVLELAGLTGRENDRVGTYSKGMQQRLGLAVALIGKPALVFLDEPTSALDPVGRHDVRELLRALRDAGTTVFLNSHLLTEVEQICDRVAIVKRARVIAEGTIEQIAGAQLGVRVAAIADGTPLAPVLERFGEVVQEAQAWTVRGVTRERIPDVVAAVVGAGARVYSVEPIVQSLEARFLEMMEAP